MNMLKTGIGLAAFALLAGCANRPLENERWPEPAPVPPAAPPVYQPPAPTPMPVPQTPAPAPAQSPVYHPASNDQCGAAPLQYLVGRPRTEIPVPLQPSMRRVVCSTCVMTQDFRADRQTIIFDSDTGIIKSVACG